MTDHPGPFERIVCGIDGTRESFEAARQAARLAPPGGRLLLLGVVELYAALDGRWGPERGRWRITTPSERKLDELMAELRGRAAESLEDARAQLGEAVEVEARVVDGTPADRLREVARDEGAALLAVGTHGGGRLSGLAVGEATTMLLRDPETSILIARPPFDPARFPARIVVGFDGSAPSRAALATAARIAERADGRLTVIGAEKGGVDADALAEAAGPHDHAAVAAAPVDALIDAAQTADLLVVGSRGLTGVTALGSVSERVAHEAASSVLVVA